MTATMTMTDQLTQRRAEATGKLLELSQREAQGQHKKSDGESLENLLLVTGRSPEQFDELVEIVRDRARLQDAASDKRLNAAGRAVHEARHELKQHVEQTRKLAEQARLREIELHNEVNQCGGRLGAVERARSELAELEYENRELLGHDQTDLDAYVLTCNGQGIQVSDPKAPTREVALDVFTHEQQRRRERLGKAHAIARREHDIAFNRHRDEHHDKRRLPPGPELVLPTWRDIAAA